MSTFIAKKHPDVPAFFFNNCLLTALYNRRHFYSKLGLKIVFGSLGLGVGNHPFFEYGGKAYTKVTEFVKPNDLIDGHIWLSDKDGNIYDVASEMWVALAQINGCKMPRIKGTKVIEGVSISELQKIGLHYVPAPQIVQEVLWKKVIALPSSQQNVNTLGIQVPSSLNGEL